MDRHSTRRSAQTQTQKISFRSEARWASSMGEPPACLGHYAVGDKQCDGAPCIWRTGCGLYQQRCNKLGIQPDDEKGLLGGVRPLIPMLYALIKQNSTSVRKSTPEHRIAWDRFLRALLTQLPVEIAPTRELAEWGQLYVYANKKDKKSDLPQFWAVSIRYGREPRGDSSLLRFFPRPIHVIEPTVQWRSSVERVFELYPNVRKVARRWRSYANARTRETALKACAVRIYPERIEDVGRLVGRMVRLKQIEPFMGEVWPTD